MSDAIGTPVLSARGIRKSYGWVQALTDVTVDLHVGEVLAVVGDNGAGKSTLMKILAGVLNPDEGHVLVRGQEVNFHSAHHAQKLGVAAVYQDLAVINQRDIAANVYLGREPCNLLGVVQRRRMLRDTVNLFDQLGMKMPSPRTLVGNLSGGQRQAVAIGRAIAMGGRILLMDEPTAALGVQQSQLVIDLIQSLAHQKMAVMVISHNLQHILSVADRICVMRRGRVVGVRTPDATTEEELVGMIVGASEATAA